MLDQDRLRRHVFESLFEGVIHHDARGRVMFANLPGLLILGTTKRRLAKLSGLQRELICQREDGSPWPWLEQPALVALQTGEPQREQVMKVYNRRESIHRWLSITAVPVFCPEQDRPVQAYTLFNDISVRKEKEKQQQEERLSRALRCSDDGYWDWSLENNEISFSPRWWNMLGYAKDEIRDVPDIWRRMIDPSDQQRVGQLLREALQGKEDSFEFELGLRHKQGTRVQVISRGFIERDADGKATRVFGNNIDITKRLQMENDLRLYQAKLQMVNETLEQRVKERTEDLEWAIREQEAFSYTVSHDLRAPLRHINCFSTILLEDYADDLPAEAGAYLDRICAASLRMDTLIDHLLELSRVNRTEIEPEPVDLSELALQVIQMYQETDSHRTAEIIFKDGVTVLGDRTLLRQLMENLLGNAWKYTSMNPVAHIEFGAVKLAGEEAFFIRDDGVGFDMEHRQRLFGAFERLHGSEFEGAGIGLATSQRIVKRHGGRIWAEGKVGEGATFYFTLPVYY